MKQIEAPGADTTRRSPHPLRIVRVSRDLNQTQLGRVSGTSRSTISRIENYVEAPLPDTTARIAAALDWPLEDLFPDDARPAGERAAVTTSTAGTGRRVPAE